MNIEKELKKLKLLLIKDGQLTNITVINRTAGGSEYFALVPTVTVRGTIKKINKPFTANFNYTYYPKSSIMYSFIKKRLKRDIANYEYKKRYC